MNAKETNFFRRIWVGVLWSGVWGTGAYLRLVNLTHNPGWYTDEGTHLEIARHLLHGRIQYLAITQSTLLFARLPLFEGLLAGTAGLFGLSMTTLRGLTAVLGILSIGLLGSIVYRMSRDRGLALLSAGMLAIYPQAILYSRLGFSYNLLVPLVLLTWWGLWEYNQSGDRRWLAMAGTAVGLGILSDLWMISLLPGLCMVVWWRRWQDGGWVWLPIALPFGTYAVISLLTIPTTFLFDLQFTLFRLNTLSLPEQVKTLALNATILPSQDSWMALGLVGLFLLRPFSLQRFTLLFLVLPFLVLGRTTALHSLSLYYMIPFFPFVAVGVAALVRYGLPALIASIGLPEKWHQWVGVITAVLLFIPFITTTWLTWERVQGSFGTAIDPFLLKGEDAQKTAEFINAHLQPDEVVIASPAIAWLINGRVTDFQMAVAAGGQPTPHLPADLPPERFAFDPHYTQARFVVIDNLWQNWAVFHIPAVRQIINEVHQWPLVFQSGQMEVYENPTLLLSS